MKPFKRTERSLTRTRYRRSAQLSWGPAVSRLNDIAASLSPPDWSPTRIIGFCKTANFIPRRPLCKLSKGIVNLNR